jgi:hypothetical protein
VLFGGVLLAFMPYARAYGAEAPPADATSLVQESGVQVLEVTRAELPHGLVHEQFTLQLDDTPNGKIRLHHVVRGSSPWQQHHTVAAVMLLHGDFSSFASNFAPIAIDPDAAADGLAPWLALRSLDVWGFDRRWALTPAGGDQSDYGQMSFAQEVGDVAQALTVARALRRGSGAGRGGPMHLIGFSRGGFLAYAAAAADAARAPAERQVRSLVPLDIWAELAPEDTAARDVMCQSAAAERELIQQGLLSSDNGFFIELGRLAQSAPDEPSPLDATGLTNRELLLLTAAQTYQFFAPTERYHLAAGTIAGGVATALSESSEAVIAQWFARATPLQSLLEQADSDGMWCADGNGPAGPDLSQIHVPLFYVGAAGGYGDHGVFSTTRVSSTDVTSLVVRRFGADQVEADFGHGDLLFARDAPTLVWEPLLTWLKWR